MVFRCFCRVFYTIPISPRDNISLRDNLWDTLKTPQKPWFLGCSFCRVCGFGANLVQTPKQEYAQSVQCGFVLYAFCFGARIKKQGVEHIIFIIPSSLHYNRSTRENRTSSCIASLSQRRACRKELKNTRRTYICRSSVIIIIPSSLSRSMTTRR